jgi:hypothetical protein
MKADYETDLNLDKPFRIFRRIAMRTSRWRGCEDREGVRIHLPTGIRREVRGRRSCVHSMDDLAPGQGNRTWQPRRSITQTSSPALLPGRTGADGKRVVALSTTDGVCDGDRRSGMRVTPFEIRTRPSHE